jgi:hypothetical protein
MSKRYVTKSYAVFRCLNMNRYSIYIYFYVLIIYFNPLSLYLVVLVI